jgi:aminopeptidase N
MRAAALVVLGWLVPPSSAPPPSGVFPADPGSFQAFAYDLELRIDRERKVVAGRESIHLRSAADGLASVGFDLNGIEIHEARWGEEAGPARVAQIDRRDDHIQIRLPVPLARGQEASLVVEYTATAPKGLVFGPDAVYTSFHTCHWMVCRDRPDDKATFALSIIVPQGLTLIASGAPAAQPTRAIGPDGEARVQAWKEPVPSSPYLFGFAMGRFVQTTRAQGGVVFDYFTQDSDRAKLDRLFADDAEMLAFFAEKAGRPLPRSFYRQVVVDGSAAQELSSFSILGRALLDARLADPTEDWLIAHELAHQFWGNLVTCASWSDFWLNEGLTTFMVAAYKERRWGRAAYERELGLFRARHRAAIDAGWDVPLTYPGAYPSLSIKRAITYSKGALFLARLREVMGERAFWTALRRYTRRFAGQTAGTRDFQRIFEREAGVDLAPAFADWAYADGEEPVRTPAR